MILHLLSRVREALPQSSVALVVGYEREQVIEVVKKWKHFSELKISFVTQAEQNGTGHAARCAVESDWGRQALQSGDEILVLPGDSPLFPKELLAEMGKPLGKGKSIRLLTCELPDPTGYGRVLRVGGKVKKIVEQKDANEKQRAIREVATSVYLFSPKFFEKSLKQLKNKNAQKEYYLTDLIGMAAGKIEPLVWKDATDVQGVNNPWELAQSERLLNQKVLKRLALQGVRMKDLESTWIESTVEIASGVVIEPGVVLRGETRIGEGTVVGAHSVLDNMKVGKRVEIKIGTVASDSVIEDEAKVGPYAHLRPESHVGRGTKIGNFVELKKSRIGAETSVAHLSYLGDAVVGERVNIGCGFVTCNFDGRVVEGKRKHETVIEDEAFIGSDCQSVAPVRIGKGAYVASGSTVTEDVPAGDLAIARSRQVNKSGYGKKLRGV